MQSNYKNNALRSRDIDALEKRVANLEKAFAARNTDVQIFSTTLVPYMSISDGTATLTLVPTMSTEQMYKAVYDTLPHNSFGTVYIVLYMDNVENDKEHGIIVAPVSSITHNTWNYFTGTVESVTTHYKFVFYNGTVMDINENITGSNTVYQLNNGIEQTATTDIGGNSNVAVKLLPTPPSNGTIFNGWDAKFTMYYSP